ncbi:hypothetical protein BJV82DRAFT_528978, partial [Fennellomyces sp. T-0311]
PPSFSPHPRVLPRSENTIRSTFISTLPRFLLGFWRSIRLGKIGGPLYILLSSPSQTLPAIDCR